MNEVLERVFFVKNRSYNEKDEDEQADLNEKKMKEDDNNSAKSVTTTGKLESLFSGISSEQANDFSFVTTKEKDDFKSLKN